ncbi:unnamed product [Ostreococcus tauri]|uniref:Unnamed product n=1 Tax=Ostreococcus tauri TaxID=70448 RepID=Q01AP6_OSTTA|nr:unnamed product [Ostreococcus tauri]CAL51752.1 unnamed product [Ostreococcus tauri]|eukprot:XP_003078872.1 unnamed product [Ostreococcus tauri]
MRATISSARASAPRARGSSDARSRGAVAARASTETRDSSARRRVVFLFASTLFSVSSAKARAKAPVNDAVNESAYVKELLRRTEENKDRRRVELQNKNCARQREYGVGDCATVDEDTLRDAMSKSIERLERK